MRSTRFDASLWSVIAAHEPPGCPFQAWSVGELVRLDRIVLA